MAYGGPRSGLNAVPIITGTSWMANGATTPSARTLSPTHSDLKTVFDTSIDRPPGKVPARQGLVKNHNSFRLQECKPGGGTGEQEPGGTIAAVRQPPGGVIIRAGKPEERRRDAF